MVHDPITGIQRRPRPFRARPDDVKERTMGATSDQVKGHAKEVAGIVAGDKELQSEGKSDRMAGEAQANVDHGVHTVEDGLDTARNAADSGLDKAKHMLDTGLDRTRGAVDTGLDRTKGAMDTGLDRTKGLVDTGLDKTKGMVDSGVDKAKHLLYTK
jgi:uncharacterized protein YjbJ (UPF0337 family)